jgi:anti-sigma-K factor RskA
MFWPKKAFPLKLFTISSASCVAVSYTSRWSQVKTTYPIVLELDETEPRHNTAVNDFSVSIEKLLNV